MSNYIPEFESQTDDNAPLPWTNCNPASHAMLLDQWTYGRIDTNDIAIRAASGVPVTSGTNFAANARAIKTLFELDLKYSDINAAGNGNAPLRWRQLRSLLRADGGAVVCGYYQSLRGEESVDGKSLVRWQPDGQFGHAVFVCDWREDDTVFWMDPLGRNKYEGDRIKPSSLRRFIWREGTEDPIVTASYGFRQTRPPRTETWRERMERFKAELKQLQQDKPAAWDEWVRRARLTPAADGLPLRSRDRLVACLLYMREA